VASQNYSHHSIVWCTTYFDILNSVTDAQTDGWMDGWTYDTSSVQWLTTDTSEPDHLEIWHFMNMYID